MTTIPLSPRWHAFALIDATGTVRDVCHAMDHDAAWSKLAADDFADHFRAQGYTVRKVDLVEAAA